MIRTTVLVALLCTPSCTLYNRLSDAVDRVDLATQQTEEALEGVEAGLAQLGDRGRELADTVAQVRAAVVEADRDGNGKVSGVEEWYGLVVQLLAIFGVGGYAANVNGKRRATAQQLYAAIDELKDRVRASAPQQPTPPAAG
jgi:hypothetical protein